MDFELKQKYEKIEKIKIWEKNEKKIFEKRMSNAYAFASTLKKIKLSNPRIF